MPYDENGNYYYMRASKVKCSMCQLKFIAGKEPHPYPDGRRVCRDCREKADLPPATPPAWSPVQSLN